MSYTGSEIVLLKCTVCLFLGMVVGVIMTHSFNYREIHTNAKEEM